MKTALACLRWVDVVRQEIGAHISNEEADVILWEHTAFPFLPVEDIRARLRECAKEIRETGRLNYPPEYGFRR